MRVRPAVDIPMPPARANGNNLIIRGDIISNGGLNANVGIVERIIRGGGRGQIPSAAIADYSSPGQFKLQVLGEDYKFDINKPRSIGTAASDDLPVNREILSSAINVVLKQSEVEISEAKRLILHGNQSVIVIRHKKSESDKHEAYIVHDKNYPAFRISSGINVLEKNENQENSYTTAKKPLKNEQFKFFLVPQAVGDLSEQGFTLEANDTIYVQLGTKKQSVDKALIWLKIVFDPQTPPNENAPILPPQNRLNGAEYRPKIDRSIGVEGIDLDQLLESVNARKQTTFLDLIKNEYGEERMENVRGLAKVAEAKKPSTDKRKLEEFIEDMALNWLLKIDAVKQIARQNNFSIVDKIENKKNAAIIAVTENGSILKISRPINNYDQETRQYYREISYSKIEDRRDTEVETFSGNYGHLIEDLEIGERASTSRVKTSPLIFIAFNAEADRRQLNRMGISTFALFDAINRHTTPIDGE